MTEEASKTRNLFGNLERRALRGSGIDIGCGNDPIFPDVRCFDTEDGDANHITDYVKEQFDFVFSSHCLEHMLAPAAALHEWWSLVKDGGYMYIVVPDEDLYEQGQWPSRYNTDHKWTFTIFKEKSWSPVSINILDLIRELPNCQPIRIAVQDEHYDYSLKGVDQTHGWALAQIQFVLRKEVAVQAPGNTGDKATVTIPHLQPEYIPERRELVDLLLKQGNFDDARKVVVDTLAHATDGEELCDLLQKIEMMRGDTDQAVLDAIQGIKRYPRGGNGRWHRLVALYMSQTGKRDSAVYILGLGLNEFPNDPELNRLKGTLQPPH